MPQVWRETLFEGLNTAGRGVRTLFVYFSVPVHLRRLQYGLLFGAFAWAALSLIQLGWAVVPSPAASMPLAGEFLNPASGSPSRVEQAGVDIDRAVAWHLFGEAGAMTQAAPAQSVQPDAPGPRDGIEEGARETRLALTLRGIVSSTDDGLGFAMIEHSNEQALYAVGDPLPLGGRVVLAKVLPMRVVLDNEGTYELLTLFEKSALEGLVGDAPRRERSVSGTRVPPQETAVAVNVQKDGLAAQYRELLYDDPESLAELVNVSAVRETDGLVGYRLSPGRKAEDFAALGFESGDVVTGINGFSLADPANAVRLYQAMREANEAVFDVQRDGQALSLSVRLAAAGEKN